MITSLNAKDTQTQTQKLKLKNKQPNILSLLKSQIKNQKYLKKKTLKITQMSKLNNI